MHLTAHHAQAGGRTLPQSFLRLIINTGLTATIVLTGSCSSGRVVTQVTPEVTPVTPPAPVLVENARYSPRLLQFGKFRFEVQSRTLTTETSAPLRATDSLNTREFITFELTDESGKELSIKLYPEASSSDTTTLKPRITRATARFQDLPDSSQIATIDPPNTECSIDSSSTGPFLAAVLARLLAGSMTSSTLANSDSLQINSCSSGLRNLTTLRFRSFAFNRPDSSATRLNTQLVFSATLQADSSRVLPMNLWGTLSGTAHAELTDSTDHLSISTLTVDYHALLDFHSNIVNQLFRQDTEIILTRVP